MWNRSPSWPSSSAEFDQPPGSPPRDPAATGPAADPYQDGQWAPSIAPVETFPENDQIRADSYVPPYRGPGELDDYGRETDEMRRAYDDLHRKEPTVRAAIDGKAGAVACLDLSVHPRNKDKPNDVAAAKFVKEQIADSAHGEDGLIMKVIRPALVRGFSVSEKTLMGVESDAGPVWGLRHVLSKDTQYLRLRLDAYRNVTGIVNTVRGIRTHDPAKVIRFTHMDMYENPFGQSDLRAAYRNANLINDAYKLWHIGLQLWGQPFLKGKVKDETRIKMMTTALKTARAAGFIVTLADDDVELIDFAAATAFDAFEKKVNKCREEIFLAVRGAYLPFLEGTGGGESHGDTDISKKVGSDPVEYLLAKAVGRCLTHQLVPDLVIPNFPAGTGLPFVVLGGVGWDETLKQLEVAEKMLTVFGLKTSAKHLYEISQMPPASEGDSPPGPQQPGGGPGGSGGPQAGLAMPPAKLDPNVKPSDPHGDTLSAATPAAPKSAFPREKAASYSNYFAATQHGHYPGDMHEQFGMDVPSFADLTQLLRKQVRRGGESGWAWARRPGATDTPQLTAIPASGKTFSANFAAPGLTLKEVSAGVHRWVKEGSDEQHENHPETGERAGDAAERQRTAKPDAELPGRLAGDEHLAKLLAAIPPEQRAKATGFFGKVAAKVNNFIADHATAAKIAMIPVKVLDAISTTPEDMQKYPWLMGKYGANTQHVSDALGDSTGIPGHLAATLVAKAVAAGIGKVKSMLGAKMADGMDGLGAAADVLAGIVNAALESAGLEPSADVDAIRAGLAGLTNPPETTNFAWSESTHPRDDHGKFVSSGEIRAASRDPKKAEELRAKTTNPEQRAKLDKAIGSAIVPGRKQLEKNGVVAHLFHKEEGHHLTGVLKGGLVNILKNAASTDPKETKKAIKDWHHRAASTIATHWGEARDKLEAQLTADYPPPKGTKNPESWRDKTFAPALNAVIDARDTTLACVKDWARDTMSYAEDLHASGEEPTKEVKDAFTALMVSVDEAYTAGQEEVWNAVEKVRNELGGKEKGYKLGRYFMSAEFSDEEPDTAADRNDTLAQALLDYTIAAKDAGEDPTPGLDYIREHIDDPALLERFSDVATFAWSEDDHPRGTNGHFIAKGDIEAAKSDPAKAAELRAKVSPKDAHKLEAQLKQPAKGPSVTAKRAVAKERGAQILAKLGKASDLRGKLTPEDLHALADHLSDPAVTVAHLREVRQAMRGNAINAGFGGAKKKDAMVAALVDHARGHARSMTPTHDPSDTRISRNKVGDEHDPTTEYATPHDQYNAFLRATKGENGKALDSAKVMDYLGKLPDSARELLDEHLHETGSSLHQLETFHNDRLGAGVDTVHTSPEGVAPAKTPASPSGVPPGTPDGIPDTTPGGVGTTGDGGRGSPNGVPAEPTAPPTLPPLPESSMKKLRDRWMKRGADDANPTPEEIDAAMGKPGPPDAATIANATKTPIKTEGGATGGSAKDLYTIEHGGKKYAVKSAEKSSAVGDKDAANRVQAEVLSGELAKAAGVSVPEASKVDIGGKPHVVSSWADGVPLSTGGADAIKKVKPGEVSKMALFDYATGHTDNHLGNYLVGNDGTLHGIDRESSLGGDTGAKDMGFHLDENKLLRTAAGGSDAKMKAMALPADQVKHMAQVAATIPGKLQGKAAEAASERAAVLAKLAELPNPTVGDLMRLTEEHAKTPDPSTDMGTLLDQPAATTPPGSRTGEAVAAKERAAAKRQGKIPAQSPQNASVPTGILADPKALASSVHDAAREVPSATGEAHDQNAPAWMSHKPFISSVFAKMREKGTLPPGTTLDVFKESLKAAHTTGDVSLSRHDLPQQVPQHLKGEIERSHTPHMGGAASFHVIDTPKATASAQPVATEPPTPPQPAKKVKLQATSEFGTDKQGKQHIAKITGTDSKYGLKRQFVGEKGGKRGDYTQHATSEPGVYEVRSHDKKNREDTKHVLVWNKDGETVTTTVDDKRAKAIAKLLDDGMSFDEARQATRPK